MKAKVDQANLKLAYLEKQVQELSQVRSENYKLKYELETLQDRYEELQNFNDEMQLKFQGVESSVKFLEKEKRQYT